MAKRIAKTERNQEIYDMRKAGNTVQSIADKYGLNEKRVRTIIQNIEDRIEKVETND